MPVDHEYNVCQAAKKQKRKWIHYCPEWDYMCIWKGTPEFDACLCEFDMATYEEDGIAIQYFSDGLRHLVCVPYSIKNLHKMADRLNINKCWFHKDHYDIPKKRFDKIKIKTQIVAPSKIVNIIGR